jgi:radical SAM protein with 4Fe4S-binding SPASM domain
MESEFVESVHLFGAEPFLHPEIEAIVDVARGRNIPVNIATNGTLLEPHLRWLHKTNTSLSVNLLGDDPRLVELLDTTFPLDSTLENVKALVENEIDTNGIICPFPVERNASENAKFYASYIQRVHDATGVKDFFILYFSKLGRGRDIYSRINGAFFRPDNWLLFLRILKHEIKDLDIDVNVFCEPAFESKQFPILPPAYLQCEMIMKDNLVVKHDMSVYPCILMLGIGESQYKLQYSGDYTAIRNAYESLQLRNVLDRAPECRKCKDLNYCSPCIPYIEHGIDYRCSGKRDTESANSVMGCPLATARLF